MPTWLLAPDSASTRPAAGAIIVEELGRTHIAGHHDRIARQLPLGRRSGLAGQHAEKPIAEIVEIMHAVPQIGIALARQAGAILALDPLDRGFGGQAGLYRFPDAPDPATVMGEHPEGLQDLVMLAAIAQIEAPDQGVHLLSDSGNRHLQPLLFFWDAFGNQVGDDDPWLVQDDMAEGETLDKALAAQMMAALARRLRLTDLGELLEVARCNDFRQHHSRGLKRLLLLFGVLALGAVLDDKDPDRSAD